MSTSPNKDVLTPPPFYPSLQVPQKRQICLVLGSTKFRKHTIFLSTTKNLCIHPAAASISSATNFAPDILRGEVKMEIRELILSALTLPMQHIYLFW